MAQQTAVEWFVDKLYDSNCNAWENASTRQIQINIDVSEYLELKRQAKQMEREQHKYTWHDSRVNFITFDQYYKETYGTRLQNETN